MLTENCFARMCMTSGITDTDIERIAMNDIKDNLQNEKTMNFFREFLNKDEVNDVSKELLILDIYEKCKNVESANEGLNEDDYNEITALCNQCQMKTDLLKTAYEQQNDRVPIVMKEIMRNCGDELLTETAGYARFTNELKNQITGKKEKKPKKKCVVL
jgi:hypothetical protein